ncbi:MAG: amidophosphoribosyltransferase [Planctomycetes bacterium]|jgi:amidophosphoribosyltransferase|nr:amidophosphoribosyltransferase [Planctomycetota bacterium]
MIIVKGKNAEQEESLNIRDIFHENCALAAAFNIEKASEKVRDMLTDMEERGEKGAGIVSSDTKRLYHRRRIGSVSIQFNDTNHDFELPGIVAIGHNRYATQGDSNLVANVQPLVAFRSKYGPFAIAHNGTVLNYEKFEKELVEKGSVFQSTSDSELFLHYICQSNKETIEEALLEVVHKIKAAYSLLVITPNKIIAVKDIYGIRPLCFARYEKGFLIASESMAFYQFGIKNFYELSPGGMVVFDLNRPKSFSLDDFAIQQNFTYNKKETEAFCAMELIYFANPRSCFKKLIIEDFRIESGAMIFKENPQITGDLVIPILDSGKQAAWGFAQASGIKYYEALQRKHKYSMQKRSFTAPSTEERIGVVNRKFNLRNDIVSGKRVVLVDDSIVRAVTMKVLINIFREAGASEVHVVISSPPISNICPFGMDYQNTEELIAHKKNVDEIREEIGADSLHYLSLKGLNSITSKHSIGICSGCFCKGSYPIK